MPDRFLKSLKYFRQSLDTYHETIPIEIHPVTAPDYMPEAHITSKFRDKRFI
jgi:hypothetical protein